MCESRMPGVRLGNISWCDGSDELAYEMEWHTGERRPVAIPPHLVEEWVSQGWAHKINHLPRDHFHARGSNVRPDDTA
jgi:hypothetical protein